MRFTVTQGGRLDQFAAQAFQLSRAQAKMRIKDGLVRCNGKVVRKASKNVAPGDIILLEEPKRGGATTSILPAVSLSKLYEDETCLVVDKPAGLSVHPASTTKGEPTVVELLREQCGLPALCLAHRLDRGTSGCLLIAKTAVACEALQQQFKERHVKKEYLAIVAGIPKANSATIDAPLGRSLMQRTKMTLFRTSKTRDAVTSYTVLSGTSTSALLACEIMTGRTHQIRVHLSAIGHPLLGDEKYSSEQSRTLSEKLGLQHPCLHAWKLLFTSPATGKQVGVIATIPEIFLTTTRNLGLTLPPL